MSTYEFGFQLRLAILEQHGNDLLQILMKLLQCSSLGMGSRESGNVNEAFAYQVQAMPVFRARFSPQQFQLLLPDLLRSAGISDPILFGHSDGASIAILHASAAPVRGLVLEAPHVFAEDVSLRSIAQAREAYERGDLRSRLSRWHQDVDAAFWGWNGPWLHPGFRGWNLTGCLSAIRAPALLIQGEADEYGTFEQIDAIARGLRGRTEKLVLAGVGHAPHKDREAAVLDATAKFLRTLR